MSLCDVPGFRVGHYTDTTGATGCTVVLCPPKTNGSCCVRGNAPGSRELALLDPIRSNAEVHGIVLAGGSAFGLAAADGLMQWLHEHGVGLCTAFGLIPIVPSAVIFDLTIGDASARADASRGYEAASCSTDHESSEGNVGVGTGATVGKWAGIDHQMKGGVGTCSVRVGDLVVGALVVVNSVGDVMDEQGNVLAGSWNKIKQSLTAKDAPYRPMGIRESFEGTNTTLMICACNAHLSKTDLYKVAERMHNGMARAIMPAHTSWDGDVTFALSSGTVSADVDTVAHLASLMTTQAIQRAVRAAKELHGCPDASIIH